jgi:hypothetical protein
MELNEFSYWLNIEAQFRKGSRYSFVLLNIQVQARLYPQSYSWKLKLYRLESNSSQNSVHVISARKCVCIELLFYITKRTLIILPPSLNVRPSRKIKNVPFIRCINYVFTKIPLIKWTELKDRPFISHNNWRIDER